MQTVYEAAGGARFFLTLANAWHARVMADDVVSHAFSHGFHPEHSQRLAAIGERHSVARPGSTGTFRNGRFGVRRF